MGLFWLGGVIFYSFMEPNIGFGEILQVSFGIRDSASESAFSGIYQLIWPMLLEAIIFGFILAVLLEQFNPVATSKIIAQNQSDHTIVLGYQHIGTRIVEYLQENQKPYVLVEYNEKKVLDLINDEQPVIVSDFTDESTLEDAGVRNCKEIFFLTNDFLKAIVCAEKVRQMNKNCSLYMRVFEDEFQNYLEEPPWNAFTFSSSKWTLETIKKWAEMKPGSAIVLGHDHIAQLIADYLANTLNRKVFMIDSEIDVEDFHEKMKNIEIIKERVTTLSKLDDYCDINEISQVFICWKSDKYFQESLLLTIDLDHNHPFIETYVRIFNEEVIPIFKKYDGKTFSTSGNAFEMLQKEVRPESNISYKHS